VAEILIKLQDSFDVEDPRTAWRTGDIFAVREDGFQWGTSEVPPLFEILKFPGVPLTYEMRQLCASWVGSDGEQYRVSLWRWNHEAQAFERKSDGFRRSY
jgi:hypothetical protein